VALEGVSAHLEPPVGVGAVRAVLRSALTFEVVPDQPGSLGLFDLAALLGVGLAATELPARAVHPLSF
jgi:hypothetical protein